MGGCQNYPFLDTLNIRCRILVGFQRGDHNFDSHPYTGHFLQGSKADQVGSCGLGLRAVAPVSVLGLRFRDFIALQVQGHKYQGFRAQVL